MDDRKHYVCERCNADYPACPSEIDRAQREPRCYGKISACYVCSNCEQWTRLRELPRTRNGPRVFYWDCVHDCAERGLAPLRKLTTASRKTEKHEREAMREFVEECFGE